MIQIGGAIMKLYWPILILILCVNTFGGQIQKNSGTYTQKRGISSEDADQLCIAKLPTNVVNQNPQKALVINENDPSAAFVDANQPPSDRLTVATLEQVKNQILSERGLLIYLDSENHLVYKINDGDENGMGCIGGRGNSYNTTTAPASYFSTGRVAQDAGVAAGAVAEASTAGGTQVLGQLAVSAGATHVRQIEFNILRTAASARTALTAGSVGSALAAASAWFTYKAGITGITLVHRSRLADFSKLLISQNSNDQNMRALFIVQKDKAALGIYAAAASDIIHDSNK